ncbi:MAG: trypsin-like peptidase domain-containing protein [bacterium]|nr:trypsin-like peptidase domain-containing protein [bacterium]
MTARIGVWLVFFAVLSLSDPVLFAAPPQGLFATVVSQVQSTVVSISVSRPGGYEFSGGRRRRSPFEVSYGSGVVLDTEGHILTNNHVINSATWIQVKLSDETEYRANIVGQDPESDLALIRIQSQHPIDPQSVARLGNSDSIRVGDWVMAIGSPFGFHHTVSVGVISAKGRHLDRIQSDILPHQPFLQTDASINPGNSGGPLVDTSGRVIGINTAYNPGGTGIGFAIPINWASRVADQLKKDGRIIRGYLGVYPQDLSSDLAQAFGLLSAHGVLVGDIESGSPADQAGLKQGDVILKIAGQSVRNTNGFFTRIAEYRPDQRLDLSVFRSGSPRQFLIQLGRRTSQFTTPSNPAQFDWPGLEVGDRTALESRRLGISKTGPGVVVLYVVPGSPADHKHIVRGDLILKINGELLQNIEQYQAQIKDWEHQGKPFLLLMRPRGQNHDQFVALPTFSKN